VPAPQCVVACSPNVVDGTRVWDARFVDVRKQVKSYHQSIGAASPYALPRACAGTGPFPSAKSADELLEPCTDYWQRGSGPDAVSTGDAIVFGHLTAHEFTQHSTVNQNDLDEGTPVPVDFTRTAEYPMYCSPLLHGQPHQGVDEVLAALLAGDLPARWAHVYTGNKHFTATTAKLFRPALPSLAASPSTPLARALVGLDRLQDAPHAVQWLDQGHDGVKSACDLHKKLMLRPMISQLRHRLRRIASGRENSLLSTAASSGAAKWARHGPPEASAATMIIAAARDAAKAALAELL